MSKLLIYHACGDCKHMSKDANESPCWDCITFVKDGWEGVEE